MSALLPCPCCGSGSKFDQIPCSEDEGENAGGQFIVCIVCGLTTDLVFACGEDVKPLLAEKWNRRVPDAAAVQAERAAIRRAALLMPVAEEFSVGLSLTAHTSAQMAVAAMIDARGDTSALDAAVEAARREVWQPIETAPRDGTAVDLWIDGEFARRWPDCFWGFPSHCCGEAGQHCDSDWHNLKPGWVDGTFNEPIVSRENKPTHWMVCPPPAAIRARSEETNKEPSDGR